ncbi:uncharacterized protein C8A04DRAFT_37425 [Dichotomopilus funicola]|uniref:Uncharacterized protein n=1 Tax=Dichotomopilus funicola TaxID=1934379 RepID=A0AAN6V298_9PEZI|nr:hypothetical protein C8A04DRAFT_37425 [Dichotomopilus funicola]
MPYQRPVTCLSNQPHDGRSNAAVHFNGCLSAAKRDVFFANLPPEKQEMITRANEQTAEFRSRLETTDRHSTAGTRLQEFKRAMGQWTSLNGRPNAQYTKSPRPGYSRSQTPKMPGFVSGRPVIDHQIKAPVVYFRDGLPQDAADLDNHFPDQGFTVADLIADDPNLNPIMQPVDQDVIRYFHLPANNMSWVEEIIARYYGEQRPSPDRLSHDGEFRRVNSKTEAILKPSYWYGQRHFDASSQVHARHMRPFCAGIPSSNTRGSIHQNMVLYMPYLHWETDRGRVRSAEVAKEASKQNLHSVADVIEQAQNRLGRTDTHQTLTMPAAPPPERSTNRLGNVDRRTAVGQVFRTAAALMEAMDSHVDEQFTMRYLHENPPLHPRRTLDQAYYGALRSTGTRDRDQVVYRGTAPKPHKCLLPGKCQQCNEDVCKTARLLMVDQLWMWVLDEQTVLACFPRSWGGNRPDNSDIQKCLERRFCHLDHGGVSSAYDLASIIIDEVSRVFFDCTKINTKQPNPVELFNAAINDLTYKQTAAFDQFLIYTNLASRDYKRERHTASDGSSQNQLLNINPEGELLKEVKDIIDELHIIRSIKEQQQTVLDCYVKHVRRSLAPAIRAHQTAAAHGSSPWYFPPDAFTDRTNPDSRVTAHFQNAQYTLTNAEMLLQDHSQRISELHTLDSNARNTSTALKDLLTLKQQQAGVIEAREAVKQANLTFNQSRSIMIFTIVTIIFLPLSFCASVFGMNAAEFNDGHLTLSELLRLMFPISTGIIVVSFLLAFSRTLMTNSVVLLLRSVTSYAWNTTSTWLAVKTGMYVAGREMRARANRLREREGTVTGAMRAEVLRREKNLEKLKAANHVKDLAIIRRQRTERAAGNESSDDGEGGDDRMGPAPWGGGAASAAATGHARPFLRPGGGEMVDVELGERARKSSSQMNLVQGR